jgi:hypothetical protein
MRLLQSQELKVTDAVSGAVHKYWALGYLNFADPVADGFFDAGRAGTHQSLAKHAECKVDLAEREVLLLDSQQDRPLAVCCIDTAFVSHVCHCLPQALRDRAFQLVSKTPRVRDRLVLLALLVANVLGGSRADLLEATDRAVRVAKQDRKSNIVPIGALFNQAGVCRHRSTLFKYLADFVNSAEDLDPDDAKRLQVRLVRGNYGRGTSDAHAWCVARLPTEDKRMSWCLDFSSTHSAAE